MGGIGSGRHCRFENRLYTEDLRSIDIRKFNQRGWLNLKGFNILTWSRNEKPIASIQFLVRTGVQFPTPAIVLNYKIRTKYGEWQSMNYPIELQFTKCNYGGIRYWFTCPECSKRVCVLYSGDIFKCRNCSGLVHKSRNESALDQATRRLDKEKNKLWPELDLSFFDSVEWLSRPKWMREPTFKAKIRQLLILEYRTTELLSARFSSSIFTNS